MPANLPAHHLFATSLPATHFPGNLGSPVLLTHRPHHRLGAHPLSTLFTRPRLGAVRVSKGVLDDEAELGHWASGLSSDSVLTRDNDTGSGSSGERVRDSDSGRYEKSNGEMGRDSFGSLSRGKARVSDESKGRNEGFVFPKRKEGSGRRVSDSGGNERPGRGMGTNSRGNNTRFGSGSEGGRRTSKAAGKGLGMGYGRNRGGGSGEFSNGGRVSRKGGALIVKEVGVDEEEREGNFRKSFGDLIIEADGEGGGKDIDGGGDLLAVEESRLQTLPSSPGTNDSYLSETRFF